MADDATMGSGSLDSCCRMSLGTLGLQAIRCLTVASESIASRSKTVLLSFRLVAIFHRISMSLLFERRSMMSSGIFLFPATHRASSG